MTTVQRMAFCGQEAWTAENEQLRITVVPAWGSNLIAIYDKIKELDLLRAPATAEEFADRGRWLHGTPVLVPPNRISDGVFTHEGREFRFPINEPDKQNHLHGFVDAHPWKLLRAETQGEAGLIETEYRHEDNPQGYAMMPIPFTIVMRVELAGQTVRQSFTTTNTSGESLPFGIGYHTTFNFPFRKGDPLNECRFALSASKQWDLNERLNPTGELVDIRYPGLSEGICLAGVPLDDAFYSAVNDGGANDAVLTDPTSGIRVTYSADEHHKHWVIYNADSYQGILCPEPYSWISNAPNVDAPDELTGFEALAPKQSKTYRTEFRVEHL